jgi:hypothetical protein
MGQHLVGVRRGKTSVRSEVLDSQPSLGWAPATESQYLLETNRTTSRTAGEQGRVILNRHWPLRVVHICPGAFLLRAAGLNAHQLAGSPNVSSSNRSSPWSQLSLVEYDPVLVLWFLAELWRVVWQDVATSTFNAFGIASMLQFVGDGEIHGFAGSFENRGMYFMTCQRRSYL